MILTVSHLVIATETVETMTQFFKDCFEVLPHFENKMFSEFVLPSGFRVAFFKPVGKSAKYFRGQGERGHVSFGVTTSHIEDLFRRIESKISVWGGSVSGPPKDHPWGEKSFLFIDPDGNRWEITESPTQEGMLVNRESVLTSDKP